MIKRFIILYLLLAACNANGQVNFKDVYIPYTPQKIDSVYRIDTTVYTVIDSAISSDYLLLKKKTCVIEEACYMLGLKYKDGYEIVDPNENTGITIWGWPVLDSSVLKLHTIDFDGKGKPEILVQNYSIASMSSPRVSGFSMMDSGFVIWNIDTRQRLGDFITYSWENNWWMETDEEEWRNKSRCNNYKVSINRNTIEFETTRSCQISGEGTDNCKTHDAYVYYRLDDNNTLRNEIRVTTICYQEIQFEKADILVNNSEDVTDNNESMPDSIPSVMKTFSYPIVKTNDSLFDKRANDTIYSFVSAFTNAMDNPFQDWYDKDYYYHDETYIEKVHYDLPLSHRDMISFIIYKYEKPGTGISRYDFAQPFTFDLKKKKLLVLSDVLSDEYETAILREVSNYTKKLYTGAAKEWVEVNKDFKNYPVSLNETGLSIFFNISIGCCTRNEAYTISALQYPEYFEKEYIDIINKTYDKNHRQY